MVMSIFSPWVSHFSASGYSTEKFEMLPLYLSMWWRKMGLYRASYDATETSSLRITVSLISAIT